MNKLKEMIASLEGEQQNANARVLLNLLKTKDVQLGENPSEEEVEAAISECLHMHMAASQKTKGNGAAGRADEAFLKKASEVVRKYLDNSNLQYRENSSKKDRRSFRLGMKMKHCNLSITISVETNPRTCRVEAVLPITGYDVYDYLFCREICKENFFRRTGALQYDESDGQILYRSSFPIRSGLHQEDLEQVFLETARSAESCYAALRKHLAGRYSPLEIEDTLQQIDKLVSKLMQENDNADNLDDNSDDHADDEN